MSQPDTPRLGQRGATRGWGTARATGSGHGGTDVDSAAETVADGDRQTESADTAQTTRTALALAPGDRVIHRLFGRGLILKVSEDGGSQTVEVLFDSAGKKTLDVTFARLEKI